MNIPSGVILYIPLLLDYEVVTGDTLLFAALLYSIDIGFEFPTTVSRER
jgi:hypothetical protein